MKLDKGQAALLKRLMQDDGWDVLKIVLNNRLLRLSSEPITGSSAFEELRALHKKQGKLEGLVEFFDDTEKMAFDE